jgi:hypothetical protein
MKFKLFKQVMARIIFLPVILAAGIVATALVTARIMFTPSDLESVVTNQFQEILKRPVRIEWARLSLTGEIKIKGLTVTEPGPETVDFLSADYIYATYRLLPLLRRRIEIDSVLLVSPKIQLIKREDGRWNIGDIFAAYRAGGGKSKLNKIADAEIKDGELTLADRRNGRKYSFERFNATLKDFKPGADSPFYASVFLRSDAFRRPVTGRFYTEGIVNFAGFDWTRSEIKDLRADLTLLDKTVRFTGAIRNFRRPELQLKAETPECKSSELAYLFSSPWEFTAPHSYWDINTVFTSTRTAEIRVTSKPLDLKAEGSFDLSLSTPQYSVNIWIPPLDLARARKSGTQLPFSEPEGKVQARLKISSDHGKPVMSRIFVNTMAAGGKFRTLTAANLNLSALLSENFASSYITTTSGRLAMGKNKLTGLKTRTQVSKDELSLTYSGKLNGEPVRGRVGIQRPFGTDKVVDYIGYSHDLAFSEAKDLILNSRELRGAPRKRKLYDSQLAWVRTLKNSIPAGYAEFRLLYKADTFRHEYLQANDFYAAAALKNITGDITKMRGTVSIKSGSGTFYQVQKTSEKDRIYYIVSMPLILIHRMNRMGALKFGYKVNDVSFNAIGGDYALNDGKVDVKNFYMSGKEFSAYATGQLDFSNETMRLKIYTISGKYYSMGGMPESMSDASGKPALAFTIEGKMSKPDFNMISPTDSGAIIGAAAAKGAAIDFAKISRFLGGKQ